LKEQSDLESGGYLFDSTLIVYVVEDSNWGSGCCNTTSILNIRDDDIVQEIILEVSGNISSLWSA